MLHIVYLYIQKLYHLETVRTDFGSSASGPVRRRDLDVVCVGSGGGLPVRLFVHPPDRLETCESQRETTETLGTLPTTTENNQIPRPYARR